MPLWQRIQLRPHSVTSFRLAASARYQEAYVLATHEHRLAAIYLWGYCAEMLLKAAYFRLQGWHLDQPISLSDLQQAKYYSTHALLFAWPGNLHYLPGWKNLLAEERRRQGKRYSRSFERSLHAHVKRLALHWSEALRYYEVQPFQGEVNTCRQAVEWLIGQFRFL